MNCEVTEKSARTQVKARHPYLYQVLLHNDDFTPMEFVVAVLKQWFHLSDEQAERVMREAHRTGKAVCGLFTKDVAETKAYLASAHAEENDHPLRCSAEPAT